MKYLHLVWAALFRRKTRTLLTLVSIIAAFLLFGLLDAVRTSFDQAGQSANGARAPADRRPALVHPAAAGVARARRSRRCPASSEVTYANWFGGAYQDPHNQVFSFAVRAELPRPLSRGRGQPRPSARPSTRRAPARSSASSWRSASSWKVGDKIPLQSTIFPDKSGSKNWPFDIVGILHASDKKTGGFFDQMLLLHWKYFDETTPYNRGAVGWYVTRVADVNQADRVAKAIDALSANSDHETRTQTEQAASASWMKQLADIGLIVGSIMGAVFFTLLLLSGNTMMQAVRERTSELAVLKTIGFSNRSVLAMVLAESVLLLRARRRDRPGAGGAPDPGDQRRQRRHAQPARRRRATAGSLGVGLMAAIGLVVGVAAGAGARCA